ncbi:MAG: 4-hydroxy-3-methylbut-2-en-1-yl diphosphate synthase [Dysgonamonadaceae bacterium]|jgi:(E)-4-hydroxy-3-methylbut-2-enyl-diphosphate synthase|nr:4-hydroxy-3-methylbut-2-en-1-yl diphosphate synthase [Dysgonamonadaceae bacterium]
MTNEKSIFEYNRRKSSSVMIGNIPMGDENPIRIQSMTNTSTMDTKSSVRQIIDIVDAGGEYVRLTTQGIREAENLKNIQAELHQAGYRTPLIADIHFNPKVAEAAARIIEKVRINPGNFADPVKTFQTFDYTDEEYEQEIEKIKERFIPLLHTCEEHNTAIRIGVNHGSLSDRIMSRYGDTPQGMVESCMEFLRICVAENFRQVVISIKASNSFVMVRTVRLLVEQMNREQMNFPLHLGVTEAGEGEDGRIRSAVGIGTLLLEGIGDTIRVSLSEDPEAEISVARLLVDYVQEKGRFQAIKQSVSQQYNGFDPIRRKTKSVKNTGGNHVPVVISDQSKMEDITVDFSGPAPDYIYTGKKKPAVEPEQISFIVDFSSFSSLKNTYPLFTAQEKDSWMGYDNGMNFIALKYPDLNRDLIQSLKQKKESVIILSSDLSNIYEQKAFIHRLMEEEIGNPVIIQASLSETNKDAFQIKAAIDTGSFFLDMLTDGIMLSNRNSDISPQTINDCSFGILQASGRRISKTEYISCPGCGRTLFDLQTVIKKVKQETSHLKGMKIAVMGCIVNGPGEMADADYGYVGAGAGKVSLYRGKECVLKSISAEKAVEELLKLISSNTSC